MDEETSKCFTLCNNKFESSIDPRRIFCKKGCKSDFENDECKLNTCEKLCIKTQIGDENNKWGGKILTKPRVV